MSIIEYIRTYYFNMLPYLSELDQYNYHLEINIIEDIDNHIFYRYPLVNNTYINKIGCVYSNNKLRYNHIGYCGTNYARYPTVRVNNKTTNVHTMLAKTFISNYDSMVVNHIDGNKSNFNLSNLEVVSVSDNNKHAMRTGLNSNSSINPIRPLLVLFLESGIIKEYRTMGELADEICLSVSTIHEHINKVNNPGHIASRNIIVKYKQ